jgi:PilZ domain
MSQYQERIGSDRRVHQRLDDARASLVELGENNSGIVLNISEGGMAILSTEDLDVNGLQNFRFQAPEFEHWIETTADIAWISDSKKQAGIRFKDLSEGTRIQLRAGISIAKTRSRQAEAKESGTTADKRAELTGSSVSASFATADPATLVVSESPQVSNEVSTNPLVEKIVEDEGLSRSDMREAPDSSLPEARRQIETKEKVISLDESKQDAPALPPNSADTKPQKPSALAAGNIRPSPLTPQQSALAEIRFRNLVVNSGVKQSSSAYDAISNRSDIYSYGKWIAVGAIALLASLLAFLIGWILGDPSRTKLGH